MLLFYVVYFPQNLASLIWHQISLKHVNQQLGGLAPAGMGIFPLPGGTGLLLKQASLLIGTEVLAASG